MRFARMQFRCSGGLALALVCSVSAQAQELRPAPAYLTDMFAQVYAAETLAQWCPTVSVNGDQVQSTWLAIFERLDADGYDIEREDGGMRDPSQKIDAAINAWAAKRGLSEASSIDSVCRAAETEMAERSAIGSFLRKSAG